MHRLNGIGVTARMTLIRSKSIFALVGDKPIPLASRDQMFCCIFDAGVLWTLTQGSSLDVYFLGDRWKHATRSASSTSLSNRTIPSS